MPGSGRGVEKFVTFNSCGDAGLAVVGGLSTYYQAGTTDIDVGGAAAVGAGELGCWSGFCGVETAGAGAFDGVLSDCAEVCVTAGGS